MKVLLIRFSAMGDIVLTSPVIRWLTEQRQAEIHYLTKSQHADLLAHHPHVRQVHILAKHLAQTINRLKSEYFDLVIDLHKNLRSIRVTTALRVKTISYDKLSLEKWLYLGLDVNRLLRSHVVDRYAAALSALVADDGCGLEFYMDPEIERDFVKPYEQYRVIVLGGTYVTKRIPLHIAVALITDQSSNYVLLGGDDVDLDRTLMAGDNVIDMIGQTTIHQAAAIMKASSMVITGDTGLMHIAAALQKPITVIWGSTNEEFGFYPYYGRLSQQSFTSISLGLACQPCSKYGRDTCPKGHMNCLLGLDAQSVINAVTSLH